VLGLEGQVPEDAPVPHQELHRAVEVAEHVLERRRQAPVQVGDELVGGEGGPGRVPVVGGQAGEGRLQPLVGRVPHRSGVQLEVHL
jgi:hypothetical protein